MGNLADLTEMQRRFQPVRGGRLIPGSDAFQHVAAVFLPALNRITETSNHLVGLSAIEQILPFVRIAVQIAELILIVIAKTKLPSFGRNHGPRVDS